MFSLDFGPRQLLQLSILSTTMYCVFGSKTLHLAFTRSIRPTAQRVAGVATYSASAKSSVCHYTIADTPLGKSKAGAALLDGLDVHTVPANDEHPLSVYGIDCGDDGEDSSKKPVLLLHGRTWSSVPVYHLLGGNQSKNGQESRSLMEALRDLGLRPYAMDFRGFGGTPPDDSNYVEPLRCVMDAEAVLEWIVDRHGFDPDIHDEMPALLGWSQGALVAQLLAQMSPSVLSKLILYGSLYDPLVRHPRAPLYKTDVSVDDSHTRRKNLFDEAMEDFTIEGTMPPEPARLFAEAALLADPIKAVWNHLYQFNNCDAARVHVPTLVVRYSESMETFLFLFRTRPTLVLTCLLGATLFFHSC